MNCTTTSTSVSHWFILEIETLEGDLSGSRSATVARVRALRGRVVTLSDDVHSLAYRFHPAILDDLGLTAALESMADDFTRREGIEIDVAQWVREKIAPDVADRFDRQIVEEGHIGVFAFGNLHDRGDSSRAARAACGA